MSPPPAPERHAVEHAFGRRAARRLGLYGTVDVVAAYESWASSPASRAVMQANRRRDTSPEMAVRRLAHARGLRYRVDTKPLSHLNRRADLVFTRAKVAVFIDGCYWHGCPLHGTTAKSNADYWSAKITRNRERDADTGRRLGEAGWVVVRAWEHDDPAAVVDQIVNAIHEAG